MRCWLPDGRIGVAPAVIIVLAGLGIGALNGIGEFFATLVLPQTNVGGYVNTGWDLVFDLAGGTVATMWFVKSQRAAKGYRS